MAMPEQPVHIAVVSASDELPNRVRDLSFKRKSEVIWQKDQDSLIAAVPNQSFDIIILSDDATDGDNQPQNDKLVEKISERSPQSQILFLARPENIENVVSTLESGTYQYAKQPVTDHELQLLIETALGDRGSVIDDSEDIDGSDRFDNMIGRAPSMQQVYQQIKRAATSEIPVLILGETGTGKDLAAQIIHRRSDRSKNPFVSINLGSLPTDLVASELFGHEKGAFSGAIKQHQGAFERAQDGTVFLDEIDCIDEKVRVSLLRVLDEKSFTRLGGSDSVEADARWIAATNADLEGMVEKGEFRQDLFYRLDVFRITMPPLRRRPEDIPLLVQEFVAHYGRTHKRNGLGVTKELMDIMQAYDWPGNVRELKSVIHRAVLMCDGKELQPRHLPKRFHSVDPSPTRVSFEIGTPLEEVERTMVLRALDATNNNRKEAAKLLGISRRVIYNKLKKHHID
ncbi:AAA domain-containing protein [candidate division GN15 bacterium]|nr:AAA domain-containing protein [candidate division GN15 bacterium]